MPLDVGAEAPDFTLKDQNNQEIRLGDFRGRKAVLLVFYPFTFTGVCEGELCAIRDDYSEFEKAGVQVLACSCDTRFAQAQWAAQQGYQFPVLSDFWPHGEVAKAYGVFLEKRGMAVRGTFLVDKAGIVRFAEVNGPGEARDQSGWRTAVAALAA